MKDGVDDFEVANKPIIRVLMIMHMIWNQEWFQGMCYRNPSNEPWKDGDLAWPYIKTRIFRSMYKQTFQESNSDFMKSQTLIIQVTLTCYRSTIL